MTDDSRKLLNRRVIQYNPSNTKGVSSPLIPFNCIIDTDVGLLRLIENHYANPDIFNRDFFVEHNTTNKLVSAVYLRTDVNPLLLCLKDKNKDKADSLYNQFFKEKYPDILVYSVYTGVFQMCKLFETAEDATASIVYHTDEEKELLDYMGFKNVRLVSLDKVKQNPGIYNQYIFRSSYDQIYLKALVSGIKTKQIYFLDYKCNFMPNVGIAITPYLVELEDNNCQIAIMNAYDNSKLEIPKGDNTDNESE